MLMDLLKSQGAKGAIIPSKKIWKSEIIPLQLSKQAGWKKGIIWHFHFL